MSEIRSTEDFNSLLDSYSDAAWVCACEGATSDDDARKARIGARVREAYSALRAENERLREALHLMMKAFQQLHHACGAGSYYLWPEYQNAEEALAPAAPAKEGE